MARATAANIKTKTQCWLQAQITNYISVVTQWPVEKLYQTIEHPQQHDCG